MGRLGPGFAPRVLESAFRDGVASGLTDQELLERFARCRDQAGELAFATLVARPGPMVQGVCRRMLRDPADVDDAFQATFLVLVRRATSLRKISRPMALWRECPGCPPGAARPGASAPGRAGA
jgi:hypothetical protein